MQRVTVTTKDETSMSLPGLILAIRKHVNDKVALPEDYPDSLKPLFNIYTECNSEIGIIFKSKITEQGARNSLVDTLCSITNAKKEAVITHLNFDDHEILGGPIRVTFIPESAFNKIDALL